MVTNNTCKYCNKTFVRHNSLVVHLCEPKRRWRDKDDKGDRLGFNAYLKFYNYTQSSTKVRTQMDFIKSPYYKAFVKFGRYCVDIKAIAVDKFIEFLIKNNTKLDYWTSDSLYSVHLGTLLKTENPIDALMRALKQSITWAEENDTNSNDMLRSGNVNVIYDYIIKGRISPWVLYNCSSGVEFLSTLYPNQITSIWKIINAKTWNKKFKDYPTDAEYIKKMLNEAGW